MNLEALTDLCTPWCVHVVVTLRIAEHLAEGPRAISDLACAATCDADALARVLRHLIARGLFDEPSIDVFAANEAARGLTTPAARIGLDLNGIGGRMAGSWSTLLKAVQTGKPAYADVFGRPFWEDLEAHSSVAESFDALMGTVGHGVPDARILLKDDWDAIHTVADIGGGTGALLAEILKAHPNVRGILVDFPQTIGRAAATFEAARVADRVTTFGQSFFEPLPPGANAYVLKNVLGDWPDDDALALLRRCAEAARPSAGRVLVLGGVSPDDNATPSPELLMLVLVGGKDRPLREFRTLATSAGLEVTAAGRLRSGRFAVECRPL